MMKRVLILALMSVGFAPGAFAYGALAIDRNQGPAYGFAYDYTTPSQAQQRALSECGGGCRVVQTFSGGCAAYAADQTRGSTIYGWAKASNSGSAQNTALRFCRERGGKRCIVRVWGCEAS